MVSDRLAFAGLVAAALVLRILVQILPPHWTVLRPRLRRAVRLATKAYRRDKLAEPGWLKVRILRDDAAGVAVGVFRSGRLHSPIWTVYCVRPDLDSAVRIGGGQPYWGMQMPSLYTWPPRDQDVSGRHRCGLNR